MDTKKVFKDFHKKSQQEIVGLVQKFVREDFFVAHPELKNTVSILITGSVAEGKCDERSDIDLVIIFSNKKTQKKYKFLLLSEFKNAYFETRKPPLEIHGKNITSFDVIDDMLSSWKVDWMLREFAHALVIHDPKHTVQRLKEKYVWYPQDVYAGKMCSLFAESSFLLLDRYKTGMERGSLYFIETIKYKIVRCMMASLIMAHHEYPTYDKHLYECLPSGGSFDESKKIIDKILSEKNPEKIFTLLGILRKNVENILISKKIIPRKNDRYWMSLRSTYFVTLEG